MVDAIQLKHVVDIVYKSIKGKSPKERSLHPYLLKEYDDRWYVYGFDVRSEEERIFGLDRVNSLNTNKNKDYRYFAGDREKVFKNTIGVSRFVGKPEEILLKFYYPKLNTSYRNPYINLKK